MRRKFHTLLPDRLTFSTYIIKEEKKEREKKSTNFKKRKLCLQTLNNLKQEENLLDHLVIEQTALLDH